jgi:hypothetical protein
LAATVLSAHGAALDRIADMANKKNRCYGIVKTFYLQLHHVNIGRQ